MSIECNKQLVKKYVDYLNAHDIDGLGTLFSDTFTWILPVRATALREMAKPRDKAESIARNRAIFSHMRAGPDLQIRSVTAEDDRVNVEISSHVVWDNGKEMNNLYHHAFVMKDGKIEKVTEYLDFAYVIETSPLIPKAAATSK